MNAAQLNTLSLIQSRVPRHAMNRAMYSSPDVYAQDLEQIWYKEWIFAGHSFEIKEKGEYLTLQLGDYPIIITRDANGEIKAFHNACRHRGTRLCTEARGKVAKLTCPYHSWTFELDGSLLYAPNMGDNFDPSKYSLMPVHCEVVNSYIYICVAETAPDFEAFRQSLSSFVTPHYLEDAKVAYEYSIVEQGNWKLVFENNRECYHCHTNHPELLRSFQEDLAVAGVGAADNPELLAFWDKCEAAGLPSNMKIADDGQYRMTRIQLFGESVSFTMDGKPAVSKRLDKSGLDNPGALLYFNYPSTWNHVLGDHALSFRMLPVSSTETQLTTKWLVPKDAQEGVDYDLENLIKVWTATNAQDRSLVEAAQMGLRSPSYVPGPYSDIEENGVCQFVDWYCDTMTKKLKAIDG